MLITSDHNFSIEILNIEIMLDIISIVIEN